MPHFTIQYSANLAGRIDIAAMVECVRLSAVSTGIFPLAGIRVRAVKCDDYAIADGRKDASFIDMLARIGEGRDIIIQRRAGEVIFKALSSFLEPVFTQIPLALSFDIQVSCSQTSWKRNALHELIIQEQRDG